MSKEKKCFLFLDDTRIFEEIKYPPEINEDDYYVVTVRNYETFVKRITQHGLPDVVSFDHDLADEHYLHGSKSGYELFDYSQVKEYTGYHCAIHLVNYCHTKDLPLPKWFVHSFNPIGRYNISQLLTKFSEDYAS